MIASSDVYAFLPVSGTVLERDLALVTQRSACWYCLAKLKRVHVPEIGSRSRRGKCRRKLGEGGGSAGGSIPFFSARWFAPDGIMSKRETNNVLSAVR